MPAAAARAVTGRPRASAAQLERSVRTRLAQQRSLVRELLRLRTLAGGSVFARWGRCGKEGCACGQGRGHGPYYVFSRAGGGTGSFAYLEAGRLAEAKALVDASREFRRGLRRLRKVNGELVALLRRYHGAAARAGERRLGVTART